MTYINLKKAAVWLPEGFEDAAHIARESGVPEHVVAQKMGIVRKCRADKNTNPGDMAVMAAKKVLKDIDPLSIDMVIWTGSEYKDYIVWTAGIYVQRELGLKNARAFDISARCSNKILGLHLAKSLMMTDKKLSFVNLGSSATMHYKDANERQKNLDAAKQFIDLAHEIDCSYIRVFPNNFPKEQERNETIDLIIDGLKKLGAYAKGSKVKVLMETHGDVVWVADIVKIMQSAGSDNTGLIWDLANMWNVTKEKPADVYPQIKKYIHHTHIKDNTLVDDKISYKLLGKGVVPIFEGIDLLYKDGYKGY